MIFGERKDRRSHWSCRINERLQMGVVIVKDVRRNAIHKGGIHDIKAFATPKNGRLGWTRKGLQSSNGNVDCLVPRATYSYTNPVKQRSHPFLAHFFR